MNATVTATSIATTVVPAQLPWYAVPEVALGKRPLRAVGHETDRGFCSVCGAVWPCARARREERLATNPFSADG